MDFVLLQVNELSLLHTFISIFFINSENDLEEVLTYYTQKNKSATVFLGTKIKGVKKDVDEIKAPRASSNSESCRSEFLPCFLPVVLSGLVHVNISSFKHGKQESLCFVNQQSKRGQIKSFGVKKRSASND